MLHHKWLDIVLKHLIFLWSLMRLKRSRLSFWSWEVFCLVPLHLLKWPSSSRERRDFSLFSSMAIYFRKLYLIKQISVFIVKGKGTPLHAKVFLLDIPLATSEWYSIRSIERDSIYLTKKKKKSLITIFPQNWKILLELLLPRARVSFRALFHPTWNTDVDRARWAFVALTSKTITACTCLPCPLQKTAFFFHFLRFYPNIVDWKFCGDFCWTRRESVTDTHIYSFSEPFPIQVITGY